MKKYLTLAVVLGAIAFLSVSYLAHAEEKAAAPVAAEKAMDAAPAAMAAPPAAPAADQIKVDTDMCNMLASAPTTEGSAPTPEAKDAAFKKCMAGKGHGEEKKAEDKPAEEKKDAPAATTP